MKVTLGGFGRTILVISAPLALAACLNAPLGQSTSPSAPIVAAAQPVIVLPRPLGDVPRPGYPEAMLKDNISAIVMVDCLVDEKGRLVQTTIHSSTHPAFNEATLEAVRRWKFAPGTRDGVPATLHVVVPVEYSIERVARL